MAAMTHTERVKSMLRTRRAVCATSFLAVNMPAARNRVGDLRKTGWVIDSKHMCQDANHKHLTRQIEYRLISEPGGGQQKMMIG